MSEQQTGGTGGQGAGELSTLKRAFLAIDRLQTRVRELEQARREPIAVVGIGCRFPGGASTPEAFSRLLREGKDAVVARPPVARPNWSDFEDAEGAFPPAGYLQDDPAAFDPVFFGIAPREAATIDPQQRLVLECAWEALEHAAINPRGLEGSRTGVFMGAASTDWIQLQLRGDPGPEVLHSHFAAGVGHSMISGRVSYVLGLQGPSVSIDTACSSSLVAVHTACQALRAGECDLALAGGVNLILGPDFTLAFRQSRMLAEDGRCRTFDAAANGFARGEGCGIVVLRRLSDALQAGDRILAVVRGSAVNQDGPSSGLTAPNGPAQEAVIRAALEAADVEPASVGYVEAHGTGTILGDPIEVQALGAAYGPGRDPGRPLRIGSVKTNLGHLEAAAGIAGFIKVVLALQERTIPAHLHFRTPNPHIPWERLPVVVASETLPFEEEGGPRRAGLSSFGFSGTNVHMILEEAPQPAAEPEPPKAPDRSVYVLPLSAGSREGLRRSAEAIAELLADPEITLADVCHTAGVGRAPLPERLSVVARTRGEARDALLAWTNEGAGAGVAEGRAAPEPASVAFLYTGQGSQRPGMGHELYKTEPVFREVLDRAAAVLDVELGRPFLPLLFGESADAAVLQTTAVAQPALVALELALSALWRSWGVRPDRVLGHSVGEYAAAVDAGVMGFEDGLRLIAARGRLMQALPPGGAMVALFTGPERVTPLVEASGGAVAIAAINAADSTVISGDEAAVLALAEKLAADGVQYRRLAVSHAFHSQRMEPMLDAFREVVAGIRFSAPRIPLISNVTGAPLTAAEAADPEYWCRHIRQPVRFADGVHALLRAGAGVLLECGPDGTLTGMASRTLSPEEAHCIPSLRAGRGEQQALAEALARLHAAGAEVDWATRDEGRGYHRIALPVTIFNRARYWFPTSGSSAHRAPARQAGPAWRAPAHPILGSGIRTPDGAWVFERALAVDTVPFIADHRVGERVIVPATVHVELLLAAARAGIGWEEAGIEDLTIREALTLEAEAPRSVQVRLERAEGERCRATIHSLGADEEEFRLHAEAMLVRELPASEATERDGVDAEARCAETVDADSFYAALDRRGLHFGPAFRGVAEVRRTDGEAMGRLVPPAELDETPYRVHPALLDAGIQVLAAAIPGGAGTELYLPLGIQRLRVNSFAGSPRRSHVRLESRDGTGRSLSGTVVLYDAEGTPAVSIEGIQLARASEAEAAADGPGTWVHRTEWERRARTTAESARAAPGTAELIGAADASLTTLGAEYGAAVYGELHRDLESLSADYMLQALLQLGWVPRTGEKIGVAELMRACGILPRHERLVHRMLRVLEGAGILRALPVPGWEVVRVPDVPDPESRAAALQERYRPHDAELSVTARCGAGLARVLDGSADPLELLFPGGDTSALSRIYRDTPVAKTYNGAIRAVVRDLVAQWPAERPLRILEVGAGTGGTTAHVLEVLPVDRVTYTFTDIGQLFVNRARDAFGDLSFMRFGTLDIDRDPWEQGFEPGAYDLVLASNVLHATRDLRSTLGRMASLLAPDGLLCMLEVTCERAWVDLTVGLTEGWWLYQDVDLRSENPVLSRGDWLSLLESVGFRDPAASGEPEEVSGLAGQSIVVARRPVTPVRQNTGRWVVLADASGTARHFCDHLARDGAEFYCVEAGPRLRLEPDSATVPAGDPAAFRELFSGGETSPLPWSPTDVAVFWPLDAEGPETDRLERGLGGTLHLVQALITAERQPPRLHLVTRGAQPAGGDVEHLDPVQAALWGFARSLAAEHPELRCRRLDLDPAEGWTEAATLELIRPDAEPEVAFRAGERRVARLVPVQLAEPKASSAQRLHYSGSGLLEDLAFTPAPRRAPGPLEIEIEIEAAGMNFRDVIHALGVRSDVEALGTECVGRVVAVGSDVTGFEVGDRVLAATGAFGDFVTLHSGLAVPVPPTLSVAEAATLPIAFLTADRALREVAGMRAGQRILIHAAAGGVGMAAVQLAVAAGLQVYGTAGTEEKRRLVREMGAREVFDSRSLDFEAQLMEATGGAGVDLVLNSLAGDFIPASLRVLAEGGALIELGKTGGWDDERARAEAGVKPGIRYVPVDLSHDLLHRPEVIQPALHALVARVSAGELAPLPHRIYPLSRATEAFRAMAAGRHTGKLVLVPDNRLLVRADGAYLVTGGLSGLGLRVAERLVERGAGAVILAGRSTPGEQAMAAIARMREAGAQVHVLQADVSVPGALEAALAEAGELPPIRGVVHSAGTLRDAALVQQSWADFAAVLGPKAMGVRNLEAATRDAPLDFFLIFSSMASVLGSAGQANHAAANAFLDAVAVDRVARGRTAVSLAWGAWGEIGAAVRYGANERAALKGLGTIDPETGLALTERLASAGHAAVMVSPVRWSTFVEGMPVPPFLERVAREAPRGIGAGAVRSRVVATPAPVRSLAEELAATAPARRRAVLRSRIQAAALRVLGLPPEHDLDERQPLGDLGLDSLMAVELRNALGSLVGRTLPATLLFEQPTIGALTAYLGRDLLPAEASPGPEVDPDGSDDDLEAIIGRIEGFSEAEVERHLNRDAEAGKRV